MLAYYLRLLWDPAAWQAWQASNPGVTPVSAWERLKTTVKGILLFLGGYIMTTPADQLPSFLTPKYGAILMFLSAYIQKKPDLVTTAATMTDSQKVKTQELLATRAGAPDAVAPVPATPPKV